MNGANSQSPQLKEEIESIQSILKSIPSKVKQLIASLQEKGIKNMKNKLPVEKESKAIASLNNFVLEGENVKGYTNWEKLNLSLTILKSEEKWASVNQDPTLIYIINDLLSSVNDCEKGSKINPKKSINGNFFPIAQKVRSLIHKLLNANISKIEGRSIDIPFSKDDFVYWVLGKKISGDSLPNIKKAVNVLLQTVRNLSKTTSGPDHTYEEILQDLETLKEGITGNNQIYCFRRKSKQKATFRRNLETLKEETKHSYIENQLHHSYMHGNDPNSYIPGNHPRKKTVGESPKKTSEVHHTQQETSQNPETLIEETRHSYIENQLLHHSCYMFGHYPYPLSYDPNYSYMHENYYHHSYYSHMHENYYHHSYYSHMHENYYPQYDPNSYMHGNHLRKKTVGESPEKTSEVHHTQQETLRNPETLKEGIRANNNIHSSKNHPEKKARSSRLVFLVMKLIREMRNKNITINRRKIPKCENIASFIRFVNYDSLYSPNNHDCELKKILKDLPTNPEIAQDSNIIAVIDEIKKIIKEKRREYEKTHHARKIKRNPPGRKATSPIGLLVTELIMKLRNKNIMINGKKIPQQLNIASFICFVNGSNYSPYCINYETQLREALNTLAEDPEITYDSDIIADINKITDMIKNKRQKYNRAHKEKRKKDKIIEEEKLVLPHLDLVKQEALSSHFDLATQEAVSFRLDLARQENFKNVMQTLLKNVMQTLREQTLDWKKQFLEKEIPESDSLESFIYCVLGRESTKENVYNLVTYAITTLKTTAYAYLQDDSSTLNDLQIAIERFVPVLQNEEKEEKKATRRNPRKQIHPTRFTNDSTDEITGEEWERSSSKSDSVRLVKKDEKTRDYDPSAHDNHSKSEESEENLDSYSEIPDYDPSAHDNHLKSEESEENLSNVSNCYYKPVECTNENKQHLQAVVPTKISSIKEPPSPLQTTKKQNEFGSYFTGYTTN